MKKLSLLLLLGFILQCAQAQSISAEQIIDAYLENTGGKSRWIEVQGTRMLATLNQADLEIPLEIIHLADGRTYSKFTMMGSEYLLNVFDGETLWATDMQTMQPKKSDEESMANFKLDQNDFPDAFLFYKRNGYETEYLGRETIEEKETHKVKLTKEPRWMNGEVVEDVTYYFFDVDTMLPIAQKAQAPGAESGEPMSIVLQSDYREVDGLYFPFSLKQGLEGGTLNGVKVEKIIVNPEVDPSIFQYRGQ